MPFCLIRASSLNLRHILHCPKLTVAGVVDYNVDMAVYSESVLDAFVDRGLRSRHIEVMEMGSGVFDCFEFRDIAPCSYYLFSSREETMDELLAEAGRAAGNKPDERSHCCDTVVRDWRVLNLSIPGNDMRRLMV